MVTPATLVCRNADYGNTWRRAAVVRPCGHRLACHPSDERFEPTSNLSHITFTAGGLQRTGGRFLADHASAVARRPRVEHRTHRQARWPICPVGSLGRNRAAMNAPGGATPSTE
jgi:hypothetical protein